jgi:hypothetical protein
VGVEVFCSWALGIFPFGFSWVFFFFWAASWVFFWACLFFLLARCFLCILPVYLGASYAFNKTLNYLSKKKIIDSLKDLKLTIPSRM